MQSKNIHLCSITCGTAANITDIDVDPAKYSGHKMREKTCTVLESNEVRRIAVFSDKEENSSCVLPNQHSICQPTISSSNDNYLQNVSLQGSPNIKHNEATCTSTFQHSIRSSLSPCAPPKPNLSAKLETGTDVLFGPTGNAAMQSRLVIDPSNCGMSEAPTTPVLHPEASPLDCFDTNTYCADLSYKPSAGSLLSPVDANCHTRDVRQPTRVVNYQGYSGGTVTLMPPACDTSQHQFKVVHLDGRGTVLPVPSRSIQTPATPLSCTVACSTLSSAFQQCFAGQARHVDVHGKVLGTVTTRVTRGIIGCSKSDEAVDSVCNGQGNHMLLNLPQTDKLGLLSPNRQQHLSMVCSYTSRPPGVDVIGRQDNVFGAAYRCRPTHVSPHRSRSVEPRCVGGRDWIGCNVQPGHAVGTSVSGAQYRTHSLAGSVAVGINQGDMIPSCVLSPTVHQILHNAPLNSSQVSVGATLYGMAQIKGHGSFESSNRLLETVGNGHGYVADTASFSSPLVHHGSSGAFPFISRSSSHSSLSSDSAFLTPPDLTAVLPRRWSGNIQEEDAYITGKY